MSSLFNINFKYINLMRQIEDVDGELTPELEESLMITEAEAEEKIKAYHHIIKSNESEINLIKDEKERLSNLAKTKENTIKKLKDRVLEACNLFGYTGKSGNKKIDYDTLKVYTVNKDKIEVDEPKFIEDSITALSKQHDVSFKAYSYSFNRELAYSDIDLLIKQGIFKITDFNVVINKTKIKTCIEEGIEIPGCSKVTNPYINFR